MAYSYVHRNRALAALPAELRDMLAEACAAPEAQGHRFLAESEPPGLSADAGYRACGDAVR